MPYLLPVSCDFAGEFLLQESIELAVQEVRYASKNLPASRSVAAWLFVKPDRVGRLMSCITRRSVLQTTVRSTDEKLFRYWDPRVFGHLPRIMGESFLSWLGEVVHWCWMDTAGNLRQVDMAATNSPPEIQDSQFLASLRRIAEINQCLVFTEKTSAEKEAQTENHFDRLLIHAERIGCGTSVDRMTYAVLADGLGQEFETNELLSSFMAPFFEGKAAFSACVANISQDIWDQVRKNRLALS
ncbi:MAG: hypothetical protein H6R15_1437 [Proteobacteria bacterium]|nr:hypothetical protein [Pseudomonadota bacterium]